MLRFIAWISTVRKGHAALGDNRGRHGDFGEAGERVGGGRQRLLELSAPVGKLVIAQCIVFAESGAGEPGGKPGRELLLPKNGAFLSRHI